MGLVIRNYAKTHPDLCILAVNTFVQVRIETTAAENREKLKMYNTGLRRP